VDRPSDATDGAIAVEPKDLAGITAALLPVVYVTLGWLLNEGSHFLRSGLRTRRVRAALYEELRDLMYWSSGFCETYRDGMQLALHGEFPERLPMRLPTQVYDTHFVEVAAALKRDERAAFCDIFATVDRINAARDRAMSRWDFMVESNDRSDVQSLIPMMEGCYSAIREDQAPRPRSSGHLCRGVPSPRPGLVPVKDRQELIKPSNRGDVSMERETGFEPATLSLGKPQRREK
jgi:hypothetical protein